MRPAPAQYAYAAIFLVALLLSGCAGVRVIDSAVQSYSALDANAVAAQSYRFERLPLASANAAGQSALEAWTAEALARSGLRPAVDRAAARFTVQVSAGVTRYDTLPLAAGPWPGWRFGVGVGFGGYPGYRGWGGSPFIGAGWDNYLPPTPRYQRQVDIVLREVASGSVVYQSQAVNDSGWWDSEVVLPAMIEAALQGFPAPPAGLRYVRTPLADNDGR